MALWQRGYRGRNDDGSESSATSKAAENAAWTQDVDEIFRVRLEIEEADNVNHTYTVSLQYNLNGAGWNAITTTSAVVKIVASANVADNEATTNQLTTATSAHNAGGVIDEDGSIASALLRNRHNEYEWVLQIVGTDVVDADTIELRMADAGAALNGGYSNTPSITVEEAGGGQTIPVGQVTETDLAQAIARQKARAIGQVTESDLSQAMTARKRLTVVQAIESDLAQPTGRQKAKTLGQVSETDVAQAVRTGLFIALGLVTEFDQAQPITWAPKHRLVGQVSETDIAQAIERLKARPVAQVTESDVAQALSAAKATVLIQATEADLAQGLVRIKSLTLAQVVETDSALAIVVGGIVVVIDGPTLAELANNGRTLVTLAGSGKTLSVLSSTNKTLVEVD